MADKKSLYEDRIVAFIDILGFKQIIASTLDKNGNEIAEKTHHVKYLLELASKVFEEHPDLETTKIATQFSDSIVVSFKYSEPSQVYHTLVDILHLHLEFINLNETIRGAVCFGKLHHTDKLVFGPGIVKAYEFETSSAIFPRIIIHPDVLEIGEKYAINGHTKKIEREHIDEIIKKDSDGQFYVDYFENARHELNEPNIDWAQYLVSLQDVIERGIQNTNPSVLSKFLWLKERYNELIPKYTSKGFLKNIKQELGEEFFDFYNKLKKIE